jgi:hypothetical protein
MLEKSGKTARSRTLLRKWFDAFKKLDPQRIGEISLLTKRDSSYGPFDEELTSGALFV